MNTLNPKNLLVYDINIEYPFFSGAATLLIGLSVSLLGLRKQPLGGAKSLAG